jgi:hypothetical protein
VKEKAEPKPKVKTDPALVAKARELRDRWLEQLNQQPLLGNGKYDVARPQLATAAKPAVPALPAA